MKHKLILFYGASPGAGKSTLSSRLHQQLSQQNLPVQWLYEDDVLHLDCFAPVMAHMRGASELTMPEACLAATAKLVATYAQRDTIVIADSILPYYDWLLAADYDDATLKTFTLQLQDQLRPLHPLIVYLQADVATVLQRAVAQRGEQWLDELIAFMNRWNANKTQPIAGLADAIAYFQRTNCWKRQALTEWTADILWLDSSRHSLDDCAISLLNYLGLMPSTNQPVIIPPNLDRYVGQYQACDNEPPDGQQQVTVTLVDGQLWVDLYWPNGCQLVAENTQTFQLADTSHRIIFTDTDGDVALYYQYQGQQYLYQKEEA